MTSNYSRGGVGVAAGLAAMAAAVTFLPCLANEFVTWDDKVYLIDNPAMKLSGLEFFKWAFTAFYEMTWQPLAWMSHRLDYVLWGSSPRGHHLTNILIHCVNAALVTFLAAALCRSALAKGAPADPDVSAGISRETYCLWVAALTGLLFAVHPLGVESVAWVAERKGLLCTGLYLLTMIVYLRSWRGSAAEELEASSSSPWVRALAFFTSRRAAPVVCSVLMLFAIASKSMAVSLPLVLMILDVYPLGRLEHDSGPLWKRVWPLVREKLPLFALSFVSMYLVTSAHNSAGGIHSLATRPLDARILVAMQSLIAYLGKMLLPLQFSPLYMFPEKVSLAQACYWIPALLVCVAGVGAGVVSARARLWPAAATTYLLMLGPALGLVSFGHHAMADRFAYLPSALVFLVLALGVIHLLNRCLAQGFDRVRTIRFACVCSALVICGLSARSWAQIRVWKDDSSLWINILAQNAGHSGMAFGHLNLGADLFKKGRHADAIEEYRRALKLDPDEDRAYHNMGNALASLDRFDEASIAYAKAAEINPDNIDAHVNLGNVYDIQGRPEEALEQYALALSKDPSHAKAYFNQGLAYESTGAHDEAIASYRAALRIEPGYPKAKQRLERAIRMRIERGGDGEP